jgi:hypothetical protein
VRKAEEKRALLEIFIGSAQSVCDLLSGYPSRPAQALETIEGVRADWRKGRVPFDGTKQMGHTAAGHRKRWRFGELLFAGPWRSATADERVRFSRREGGGLEFETGWKELADTKV